MNPSRGGYLPARLLPMSAGFPTATYALLHRRASALPPTAKRLLWAAASGLVFSQLNALMRVLTLELAAVRDPVPALSLRPAGDAAAVVLRAGLRAYRPKRLGGQFTRGVVHTSACACGSPRCRRSRSPT